MWITSDQSWFTLSDNIIICCHNNNIGRHGDDIDVCACRRLWGHNNMDVSVKWSFNCIRNHFEHNLKDLTHYVHFVCNIWHVSSVSAPVTGPQIFFKASLSISTVWVFLTAHFCSFSSILMLMLKSTTRTVCLWAIQCHHSISWLQSHLDDFFAGIKPVTFCF